MIHLVFGVSVLFTVGATGSRDGSVATPDPPSAKAQTALVRAFAAIEVGFNPRSKKKDLEKASADLGRALDQLADSMDDYTAKRLAAVETRDMSAKLAAIAWDRARHRERYREIKDHYDGYKAITYGGLRELLWPLKKEHQTEAYRLTWEYRLLDPGTDEDMSPPDMSPTFKALLKIGDDASITTLVYYFRHVCRDDDRDDAIILLYRQGATLRVLADSPSAKALEALLECFSWRKRQWAVLGPSYYRTDHPEQPFYELTSGNGFLGKKWRKIMTEFPRDRLSAEQRQWLEEALKRE